MFNTSRALFLLGLLCLLSVPAMSMEDHVFIGATKVTKDGDTWVVTTRVRNNRTENIKIEEATLSFDDGTSLDLNAYQGDRLATFVVDPGAAGDITLKGVVTGYASPTRRPIRISMSEGIAWSQSARLPGAPPPAAPRYLTPSGPCGVQLAQITKHLDSPYGTYSWLLTLRIRNCSKSPVNIGLVWLAFDDATRTFLVPLDHMTTVKLGPGPDAATYTGHVLLDGPLVVKPGGLREIQFINLADTDKGRKPMRIHFDANGVDVAADVTL